MQAALEADERNHIATIAIAVQEISDAQNRKLLFSALTKTWPHSDFLEALARGNELTSEPIIRPAQLRTDEARCLVTQAKASSLELSRASISDLMDYEVRGLSSSAKPGQGPVYQSLSLQRDNVERQLREVQKAAAEANCPL